MQKLPIRQNNNLQALCALSDSPETINPQSLTEIISNSPDPETALRVALKDMPAFSSALQAKWQKIITDIWSTTHSHLSELLNLPFAAEDVHQTRALNDAHAYLNAIQQKPITLVKANHEWLVDADDAYYLATQTPSLAGQVILQLENEWQYLLLRRLRTSLEALRLIRRYENHLVIVKHRYQKFISLPLVHQYYLLWHADVYHVDWQDYAGIWGDYLNTVQEYPSFLWGVSQNDTPNTAIDIRQWNKDTIEAFHPLWQQEGLIGQQTNPATLLDLVRLQSIPTALTQVILKDLYIKFGLIDGQGTIFVYTPLGLRLLNLEYTQELPCGVELLS